LATTPAYSESNRAGSFCVFPTPPGNRQQPVRLLAVGGVLPRRFRQFRPR
jgi:hypothetical protein